MTNWIDCLKALIDGPAQPMCGIVEDLGSVPPGPFSFATVDESAMFLRLPPGVRVWRHQNRARIELPSGSPYFASDGRRAWHFPPPPALPRVVDLGRVIFVGPGAALLEMRGADYWLRRSGLRPTGPTREVGYLGRDCWEVELATGERRSGAVRQLVIDRESGAVLQERDDDAEVAFGFTELAFGSDAESAQFAWTGPSTSFHATEIAARERYEAKREAARQTQLAWFGEAVADPAMTVPVTVDLSITGLREYDESDGSFYAYVGGGRPFNGVLTRRPRSEQEWALESNATIYRWSTADFDWALWIVFYRDGDDHDRADLDPPSLARLRAHLHPGADVDREHLIVPPWKRMSRRRSHG